mmetsp:Transcript_87840/g.244592  ORF Transcript_87840/g.244592 Transcript_87840/m.244592 type:complete len:268 (+) Transcript_87840:134-937(+)
MRRRAGGEDRPSVHAQVARARPRLCTNFVWPPCAKFPALGRQVRPSRQTSSSRWSETTRDGKGGAGAARASSATHTHTCTGTRTHSRTTRGRPGASLELLSRSDAPRPRSAGASSAGAHLPEAGLVVEEPTPPVGELQVEHAVGAAELARDPEALAGAHLGAGPGCAEVGVGADVDVLAVPGVERPRALLLLRAACGRGAREGDLVRAAEARAAEARRPVREGPQLAALLQEARLVQDVVALQRILDGVVLLRCSRCAPHGLLRSDL